MPEQLRMVWPGLRRPLERPLPEGYTIRSFQKGDEKEYAILLNNKDLKEWTVERLRTTIFDNPLSPEGIYFIIWNKTLAGTACALDRGISNGKKAGELGWVAVDQTHRGKGLGLAVCTQVVKHLLEHNYEEISLLTDHWRYGAVKTYLKLGFEPVLAGTDDNALWSELFTRFGMTFRGPKKEEIFYSIVKYKKGRHLTC